MKAAMDMLALAFDEQPEQWGSCMDRMSPQQMATFHQHLTEMKRSLENEMKRRGVVVPLRLTFSADNDE